MTIDARLLTLETGGIPGYTARPDGPGPLHRQPHYADLTWPLVTDFLQRRV
jgi:hypothetical protein